MRLLYRIISKIYFYLIANKIVNAPPKFLFNKPKQQLTNALTTYILADINFNYQERGIILEAISDLENFCNGLIQIDIFFELDVAKIDDIECTVLLKADDSHPTIIESDNKISAETLGLCQYMTNGQCRLYLVQKRLYNEITFRTTIIHELGHFIGMKHTEMYSIMHKSNFSNILYPTYIDAKELGLAWNIKPECFRYFIV
jgi:hypothetical protein